MATQMLDSMIRNPIPTRAEVSDVANAVFDSTDVVMLSGESASGKYPIEAVDMMRKILEATDSQQDPLYEDVQEKKHFPGQTALASKVADMIKKSEAKAIVVKSADENLARTLAHFRPGVRIFAITKNSDVAKRLMLVWGVVPLIVKDDKTFAAAKKSLTDTGFLKKGDETVWVDSADRITIEII